MSAGYIVHRSVNPWEQTPTLPHLPIRVNRLLSILVDSKPTPCSNGSLKFSALGALCDRRTVI